MAKITLPTIASGYATVTQLNNALDQIEAEFQNKVLYRSNPGGEANEMSNHLDMNGFSILNVADFTMNGLSILASVNAAAASASAAATSAANAAISAASALASKINASTSETNAANSATAASIYSSLGLGGASAFDFGLITDTLIIFPTDWGTIV